MFYSFSWWIKCRQMCYHCTVGCILCMEDNRSPQAVCLECISYGGSDKLGKGKGHLWCVAEANQHPL